MNCSTLIIFEFVHLNFKFDCFFRLHFCSSSTKLPSHLRNTVSESHVMTKAAPAAHLKTNDDNMLDIALLNDSLAVRQAGLTVQKHRNAHYRNHRYFTENASCERFLHNRRLLNNLFRFKE